MPLPPGRVRHRNQQNPKNLKVSEIPRPARPLPPTRGPQRPPCGRCRHGGPFTGATRSYDSQRPHGFFPRRGGGNGGRLVSRCRCDCPLWATAAAGGWATAPPSAGTPGAQGLAPPPSTRQGTRLPRKGLGAAGGIGTPGWPGCREGSPWTAAAPRQHCPAVRCAPHPTPAGRKRPLTQRAEPLGGRGGRMAASSLRGAGSQARGSRGWRRGRAPACAPQTRAPTPPPSPASATVHRTTSRAPRPHPN